ncbi:hypothetical protein WS70_11110 [Burkholderia mayonis]|uniref:Uncharacterized protein n=2 Tax=Burkholderiaceae TaxID=119060 RepID=A0A1B4FF52_9BURK|nr:hypothetical protein WS70_11110 [Burkholderia mayonis]KVE36139.1 hypothetical protein WS69_12990 [Burkholderia sp. BDU5]KVE47053.1 hypothetical protein WS70_27905 [Burkholderia mayonis]
MRAAALRRSKTRLPRAGARFRLDERAPGRSANAIGIIQHAANTGFYRRERAVRQACRRQRQRGSAMWNRCVRWAAHARIRDSVRAIAFDADASNRFAA